MHSVDSYWYVKTIPGLVVFRYDAPLFFINASDFFDKAIATTDKDTKVLLINMEASVNLDTTSLDTLEEIAIYLQSTNVQLWLARTRHPVVLQLIEHGAMTTINPNNLYDTLPLAVDKYEELYHMPPDKSRPPQQYPLF